MIENVKEKTLEYTNTLTGSLGFLSGYQVCHTVCLSVIALLSVFGITIGFLPFLFLQKYNLIFWSLALVMLVVSLILYSMRPHCMSKNAIMFNAGILIAGVPFKEIESVQVFFWVGGLMVVGFTAVQWWNESNSKKGAT